MKILRLFISFIQVNIFLLQYLSEMYFTDGDKIQSDLRVPFHDYSHDLRSLIYAFIRISLLHSDRTNRKLSHQAVAPACDGNNLIGLTATIFASLKTSL